MSGSPSSTQVTDPRLLELQQLQREYRHMEINRRQYADESQSVLRKQQETIDKLRKDNDAVKADIAMIMRGTNKVLTVEQQEILAALNEQGDRYANQIDYERRNIVILEEQIAIMREKELQQRRSMGGVNASRENYNMIQKQIRILENRLDKSLVKFNEAMQFNKKLRFQIDNLRRERIVFENIYRKMERDLAEKKKAMAEIIETSNQAYEQRDTFQLEIAAMEQANRKEQEEFDEQMYTLGRLLDTELAMPAPGSTLTGVFANTNSTQSLRNGNNNNSQSSHASLPQIGAKSSSAHGQRASTILLSQQNHTHNTSAHAMRQTKSAGALLMPSSLSISVDGDASTSSTLSPSHYEIDYRERAQNFEEAFNKIKAATGIQDIDELVRTFIQSEEHNFSLFNYVTEQNNEIEKLEEAIAALREEESKYAQESGQDVNQHKEILKDLESKLLATDNLAEKYELRCQDLSRIIESLKRGLQKIFALFHQENQLSAADALMSANSSFKIDRDKEKDKEKEREKSELPMMGEAPVISEVNMVNYLGILEKKTNEMLQTYRSVQQLITTANTLGFSSSAGEMEAAVTTKGGVTIERAPLFVTVLGAGPKTPMGTEYLHVNPPKADDLYRHDNSVGHGDNELTNAVDEEEEEETRPLTRDELKYRTLSRIQRRLQNSTGAMSSKK